MYFLRRKTNIHKMKMKHRDTDYTAIIGPLLQIIHLFHQECFILSFRENIFSSTHKKYSCDENMDSIEEKSISKESVFVFDTNMSSVDELQGRNVPYLSINRIDSIPIFIDEYSICFD